MHAIRKKELGKIVAVGFGNAGYQQAQFGLSVELRAGAEKVGDFWGFWTLPPADTASWTVEDQIREYGNIMARIRDLMSAAKVTDLADLVGVPVEITFDGMQLESWRVLTEVL